MMQDFAKQLEAGEFLLFLSHVKCIELWRWEDGDEKPILVEKVEKVDKTFVEEGASWGKRRLPDWIDDQSHNCYKLMAEELNSLDDEERQNRFNQVSKVEVETRTYTSGESRRWFVARRFDTSKNLATLISSCRAVPIVGVAVPWQGTVRGRAFCFLPVGDIFTGLPVHLNACFKVKKDRRGLWLKDKHDSSLGLVGQQVDQAEWNDLILTQAMPKLWTEVLTEMAEKVHISIVIYSLSI
jgi:hypothetical protein